MMSRDEFIMDLKEKIEIYKKKCKKAKLEVIKIYYLGKAFVCQETLRRMTGLVVKITDAYWIN